MSVHDEFNKDMLWLMRAIKKEALAIPTKIEFTITNNGSDTPTIATQRNMLRRLKGWRVLTFEPDTRDEEFESATEFKLAVDEESFENLYKLFENGLSSNIDGETLYELANRWVRPMSYTDEITDQAYDLIHGTTLAKPIIKKDHSLTLPPKNSKIFKLQCGDREIKVNEYIIAKPYAVGCPRGMFDYVRTQPKNKVIKKENMPEWLKQEIGRKRLVAVIAGVGFTGEIRKAFFPVVSKTSIKYRGDKITTEELEEAGVRINLLVKQLELADMKNKNSPK